MNIWAWIVIGYLALNALFIIGRVGKPREPITPGEAVLTVVFVGLFAAGVVLAAIS